MIVKRSEIICLILYCRRFLFLMFIRDCWILRRIQYCLQVFKICRILWRFQNFGWQVLTILFCLFIFIINRCSISPCCTLNPTLRTTLFPFFSIIIILQNQFIKLSRATRTMSESESAFLLWRWRLRNNFPYRLFDYQILLI